jgi:hypothetical protein
MNDPILAPAVAARPKAAQAQEHVFSGIITNGPARLWRMSGVLLLVILLAVLLAARAEAEPRIKTDCTIYNTNRVDPIAFAQHLHHQFGNTSTTNQSTGTSLFNSKSTSCDDSWFTSAGWFPVERYEPVKRVTVYYRAPGDQTKIKAIPTGLQLLATDQTYNCGGDQTFQEIPSYGCRQNWQTRVTFPDCWNQKSLEETTMVMSRSGVCPSTHPYRIPRISFLVRHDNLDGRVANPLVVSAGVDTWEPYDHMHGDYLAANQSVFNNELLDLCLRNAPDSVTIADSRCGVGP